MLQPEELPGKMANPKFGAPAAVTVPCPISATDISAMDYWLNEAPMVDPSRQNAICFALKRLLREGAEILLRDKPCRGVDVVVNGSFALPLPEELVAWWQRVLVGHCALPLTAWVEIPVDLLAPHLRRLAQEPVKRPATRSRPAKMPTAHAA